MLGLNNRAQRGHEPGAAREQQAWSDAGWGARPTDLWARLKEKSGGFENKHWAEWEEMTSVLLRPPWVQKENAMQGTHSFLGGGVAVCFIVLLLADVFNTSRPIGRRNHGLS